MNFHEFCSLQLRKYRRLFQKNKLIFQIMMFPWWFFKVGYILKAFSTLKMFHYFLLSHEGETIHTFVTHVDILEKLVLDFLDYLMMKLTLGYNNLLINGICWSCWCPYHQWFCLNKYCNLKLIWEKTYYMLNTSSYILCLIWPLEVHSLKHNWRRKWTSSLKFVLFLFEVSMSCFLFAGSKSLFGSLKKENIPNHNCCSMLIVVNLS